MNVFVGRISVTAVLALGITGAALAREAAPKERGAGRAAGLHGIGFTEPTFGSALRTGRPQPYTWPVSDRYRPVSQPFYGRAY